ncbi:hypothetical protein E4T41_01953 [Aureobasidium subglaciale]|nr:hypothetical protein E4T41_01953 [Aureobasidium subglaciale]
MFQTLKDRSSFGGYIRFAIRILQFILGITVIGLYAVDIARAYEHHVSRDPKWTFAVVVGAMSAISVFFFLARYSLRFFWDGLMLWIPADLELKYVQKLPQEAWHWRSNERKWRKATDKVFGEIMLNKALMYAEGDEELPQVTWSPPDDDVLPGDAWLRPDAEDAMVRRVLAEEGLDLSRTEELYRRPGPIHVD